MFTNRTPWIILLLVWMAGSTWWHVCKIKLLCSDDPAKVSSSQSASNPTPEIPSLLVNDGEKFHYTTTDNFSFAKSGAVANRSRVGLFLDSLTAYLKTRPATALTITGYYAPTEQNSTSFTNLGLARADGIKQLLRQQGLPDSALLTAGAQKDDLTFSAKGDSVYGGLAFNFSAPVSTSLTIPKPLLPKPDSENALARGETFTSIYEPIDLYFPLAEAYYIKTNETRKFFKETIAYLARNKTKKLILTGYTDTTGSDLVNLQLSRDRANAVKVQLRQAGINPTQIVVKAKGEADPKADNSTRAGRMANRRVSVVVK